MRSQKPYRRTGTERGGRAQRQGFVPTGGRRPSREHVATESGAWWSPTTRASPWWSGPTRVHGHHTGGIRATVRERCKTYGAATATLARLCPRP